MNKVYECRYALESIERLRAAISDELSFSTKKQFLCAELIQRAQRLTDSLPDTISYTMFSINDAVKDFNAALESEDTFCDENFDLLFYELNRPIKQPIYTEREFKGSCLDLKPIYDKYCTFTNNIAENASYSSFLAFLPKILYDSSFNLSIPLKNRNAEYEIFLQSLLSYLHSFFTKTHPLESINFSKYNFNFDTNDDSLYCDVCKKTFTNQNVFDHHLDGKIHKRKLKTYSNENETVSKCLVYFSYLSNELDNTLELCEIEFEDEDVHAKIQQQIEENPLDIPLSWNGKPIPYWIYKLYGLDKKFRCEICSGEVYRGRKDFLKHFSEQRHTEGLKSIGIANSDAFNGITSIEGALKLAEKLGKSSFI